MVWSASSCPVAETHWWRRRCRAVDHLDQSRGADHRDGVWGGYLDARQVRRLLAMALILEGQSRHEAAERAGMDRQTSRPWVHRYNAEGVAGPKVWRAYDPFGSADIRPRLLRLKWWS